MNDFTFIFSYIENNDFAYDFIIFDSKLVRNEGNGKKMIEIDIIDENLEDFLNSFFNHFSPSLSSLKEKVLQDVREGKNYEWEEKNLFIKIILK